MEKVNYYIGIFFIVFAILFNEFLLIKLFSSDGDISTQNSFIIITIQLVSLFFGIACIKNKIMLNHMINIQTFFISSALIIFLFEFYLRNIGITPYGYKKRSISVYPEKPFFIKDSILGYKHSPGDYEITLSNAWDKDPKEDSTFIFNVKHLQNGNRSTGIYDSEKYSYMNEIWVFGCSFTHGWSINDEETFTSLLQKRYREYKFINFGCSGYGTIHQFLQIENLLKSNKKPKLAIFTYMAFHDERNVLSRSRKKNLKEMNSLAEELYYPSAKLNPENILEINISDTNYEGIPFINFSSIMNTIDDIYNSYDLKNQNLKVVSQKLISNILDLTSSNKIKTLFVGVYNDK